MKRRKRFSISCRNHACKFFGKQLELNFVVHRKRKRKDGHYDLTLMCDCGTTTVLRPALTRGLHIQEPAPPFTPAQRQQGPFPLVREVDGSLAFSLALIARGYSIEKVARFLATESVLDPDLYGYDEDKRLPGIASLCKTPTMERQMLRLYPLLFQQHHRMSDSVPDLRTRVDWGRYKNLCRELSDLVRRAIEDRDSALRELAPRMIAAKNPILTWKEYRKVCAEFGRPCLSKAYRKLVSNVVQPLTMRDVEKNLFGYEARHGKRQDLHRVEGRGASRFRRRP